MNKLVATREKINQIDAEIVELLNQRGKLAIEVGQCKRDLSQHQLQDPEREKRVLQHVHEINRGPFPQSDLTAIYEIIMRACLALQKN